MSDPQIITPTLKRSLDDALAKIKPGKKGRAEGVITLDGVGLDLGFKPKANLDVTGYVGKQWKKGWTAGARIGLDW